MKNNMVFMSDSPFKTGTLKHACYTILAEVGGKGAQVQEIVTRIQKQKMAHLAGSTPANTICSALSSVASVFVRIAPGMYSLTAFQDADYVDKGRGRKRGQRESKEENDDELVENNLKPTKMMRTSLKRLTSLSPLKTTRDDDDAWEDGETRGPETPSPVHASRRKPESVKRDEGLSQRDACIRVLQDAGPEGMSVNEVVTLIKRRKLARLVGRTPHNSITRCLSADENFIRTKPGRYALHDNHDADTRMAMCAEVLSLFFEGGGRGPPPSASGDDQDDHAKEAEDSWRGESARKEGRGGEDNASEGDDHKEERPHSGQMAEAEEGVVNEVDEVDDDEAHEHPDKVVDEVDGEVDAHTDEVDEDTDKVDEVADEVDGEVDAHINEVEEHTNELDEHINEVDEVVDEVDELVDEVEKHIDEVDEVVAEVHERTDEVDERTDEVDKVVPEMDEHIDEVAEITDEVDEITDEGRTGEVDGRDLVEVEPEQVKWWWEMREEEGKSHREDVAGEEVLAARLEAAGRRGSNTKLEDADKASESEASATSAAPIDGPQEETM